MRGKGFSLLTGLMMAPSAFGVTIAVIDSGTDTAHTEFMDRVWVNQMETDGNGLDDDGNGFADDIHGWNFANQNNQLINYDNESAYNADVQRFFEIQVKMIKGEATPEELQWAKEKTQDQGFLQQLNTFANYAHGTHVAGISLGKSESNAAMTVRLIGEQPGAAVLSASVREQLAQAYAPNGEIGPIQEAAIKLGLDALIKQAGKLFGDMGAYIDESRAEIANGSFGMGMAQAEIIVRPVLTVVVKNPTNEQVAHFAKYFVNSYVKNAKALVANAPNTLFVFAAGNDGTNNDERPVAPANIDASNKITVAATVSNVQLASFSNFGAKNVDIAYPGVGIVSAIPRDKYMPMTGTSQASPGVAHIAAEVKAANPDLTPEDVKEILMKTVDKKAWLEGKVIAAGVANSDRAAEAARLSKSMRLADAIAQARASIADVPEQATFMPEMLNDLYVMPLPTP